nr:hypothetical protein [Providencia rettgeri]
MSLSAKYIYATAKVSMSHVLDQNAFFDIAFNENTEYVYSGINKSIIVNLDAAGKDWESIEARLLNDGWSTERFPGLLGIFQSLVAQRIACVEFHEQHPKMQWHNWFTPETFMEVKPIGYDKPLFAYKELPDEQQKQANKLMVVVSPETLTDKVFAVVGNGRVVKVDGLYEMVREPDEIKPDYDRLIFTPTKERLVLKVNKDKDTVNIAMIMNW